MKKVSIFLVVLLVMSSCGSGDDSSNDLISIGGEDQSTEADQENTQQENTQKENTQQEKVNNEDSSNTEAKCEIFENSKQIDPNDFFGELHDAFMDIEENSIYNYNFEVRNGPFTLWKYEAAVELLKKVVPENNFSTLNEFGNQITWERYENFTDAVCDTYTTGKNMRNVIITSAYLVGGNDLLAFAGNWERFPYVETGPEVIDSPSPPGLEYYTKYTTTSGVIIVGGENVPDAAMLAARRSLEFQLSARPDYHEILKENNVRASLFGGDPDEDTCVLPEYTDHCEYGGFAMMSTDVSFTANASWLCYEGNVDMGGDPVIHEMAHTLNHIVFEQTNELYFYENIYKLAVDGLETGKWEVGVYAIEEDGAPINDMIGEFFAMNTERYFQNDNPENNYGSRENIKNNNPEMYELFSTYYPTEEWTYCDN